MKMSDNAKVVLNYLKGVSSDVTAQDVAEATGLGVKSVVPIFTSFVKKGLGERVEAVETLEDGSTKTVKILKLTDAGVALDPDSAE